MLSLIFLKFVSDKFEVQKAKIEQQYGADYVDMVEFYTKDNIFYLPEISRWSYITARAKQDDVAVRIDTALIDSINNIDTVDADDGVSDGVNDGVNIKLDGIDEQIIAYIRQDPYITHDKLIELTGKSLSTIQRRIRKSRQHHIERIGSDKTGYWRVR